MVAQPSSQPFNLRSDFEDDSKVVLKLGFFFQVGEKWLCKLEFFSGLRKVVEQKQKVFILIIHLFSGSRKVVDQKKNSSLQNHFSTLS